MAAPDHPKPPLPSRSAMASAKSSGAATDTAKIVALLESLHAKTLDKTTDKHPPPLPAPTQDTYSVVKRALNDASTYAEKAKRAVWVGREELSTPEETTSADQKAIQSLCEELNDPHISDALKNGQIQHHRHPHQKGDRKRRILKISFTDEKTRDKFLSLCRSSRPDTVTKAPGNFVRRDLCPYELDLERKARIDAYTMNCKLGALVYGIRDEKLIKFNGSNPRPLPSDYANRPPLVDSTIPL
ncbi:hypothetical protein PRIPAC_97850 [Pristionchus pacificus]|uniref:Uncharacterized protein n=1 Tax=Pristionchus pacificus TaxID=54126 RepID=A0A2A6D2T0_PRIPA|nr:hypothetical protein PRIPAC_97850 [Pristionchus pacificus]|eukprot:PDM84744.1 hypothetical protein PRIPAC_33767 [Pristionchus pacificus]